MIGGEPQLVVERSELAENGVCWAMMAVVSSRRQRSAVKTMPLRPRTAMARLTSEAASTYVWSGALSGVGVTAWRIPRLERRGARTATMVSQSQWVPAMMAPMARPMVVTSPMNAAGSVHSFLTSG